MRFFQLPYLVSLIAGTTSVSGAQMPKAQSSNKVRSSNSSSPFYLQSNGLWLGIAVVSEGIQDIILTSDTSKRRPTNVSQGQLQISPATDDDEMDQGSSYLPVFYIGGDDYVLALDPNDGSSSAPVSGFSIASDGTLAMNQGHAGDTSIYGIVDGGAFNGDGGGGGERYLEWASQANSTGLLTFQSVPM